MTPNQPAEIWPLVLFAALVFFLIVAMLFVGWLLGQRKRVDATNDPYESGIVSVGSAQLKISVEFYLVAMFFVIFSKNKPTWWNSVHITEKSDWIVFPWENNLNSQIDRNNYIKKRGLS